MIASARADSRTRLAVLVAAIVASSMSYIDITALTVALPAIKARLGATDAQAQWVTEAYLLFLSALILVGGALGDRFGRRRLFLCGVWVFGASSAACALAPGPGFLIASRCIQGIGAALMIPESLALITAAYEPRDRGRAIGLWSAASAIMMAIGPVLAGWVTQAWSWRWVFWINVPLAVVALLFAYLGVPESRAEDGGAKPDVAGSAFITVALALVVALLMQLQHPTGGAIVPALAVAASVFLVAFVVAEHRAEAPVVPLRLFASRRFTIACVYTLLFYAAIGGELFFLSFELQHIMLYTPLRAGLTLLPTIAIIAAGSPISGFYAPRIGERILLVAGAGITAFGLALLAKLGLGVPYGATVLPATIVLGIGIAVVVPPLVTTVMSASDADDVGAASGVNNAMTRVGNLLGIALLGIVIAMSGGSALPTPLHPQGFGHAMISAAAMSTLAALVALFLPQESR